MGYMCSPKESGDPYGIRTRVAAVKGRCPRPLDEGVHMKLHFPNDDYHINQALPPTFLNSSFYYLLPTHKTSKVLLL